VKSAQDIVATHAAAPHMPITVLGKLPELRDAGFCREHNVKVHMVGNPAYLAAVSAIHDTLASIREGGSIDGPNEAPDPLLLRAITRADELEAWQAKYTH
jgi:hypothetical protein